MTTTNATTVRCACGYNLTERPCPHHGMDRAHTFRTVITTTGNEWLGYRNGIIVAVYANRWVGESRLQARKVDSIAPVAQSLKGAPETFIGERILVKVAS